MLGRSRVLIVSASMGAGHDGASLELARRLRRTGCDVEVADLLALFPLGVGRIMRWVYGQQLRNAPLLYDATFRAFERFRPVAMLLCWFGGWAQPALRRRVARGYDLVVSTYPLATQALAALRRRGSLNAPLAAYLTDFSVHRLWLAAGVDRYLAVHEIPARQARELGAQAPVVVGGPAVRSVFQGTALAARRAGVRAELSVAPTERLALVVAGSWGVGDVAATVGELSRNGLARPVVVCGRNEALRRRLARRGDCIALGWTDDMPGLMAASDVLVQNAGGLSCLEAFAVGLPVVSHRCIPGHGRANAEAMHEAGVAPDSLRCGSLSCALDRLGPRQRERAARAVARDPVPALLTVAGGRVERVPSPGRAPRRSWAIAAMAAAVLLGWSATTGTAIATRRGLGVAHPVGAGREEAAVVLLVGEGQVPDARVSRLLGEVHGTAAVDLSGGSGQQTAQAFTRAGVPVMLSAPRRVPAAVRSLASAGTREPLALTSGSPTAMQLGYAYSVGEIPISPTVVVRDGPPAVHPGEVLVVADERAEDAATRLTEVAAAARSAGVPLSEVARLVGERE